MQFRIWGTRGSIPTPLNSSAIEDKICQAIHCMPALDTRDIDAVRAYVRQLPPLLRGTTGGNTTCVEVRAGDHLFIIDAGSGIRLLGLELLNGPCGRGQGTIHILFSHPHWDHIQGFPFFLPAYIPGNRLIFYSIHDLEEVLTDQQRAINFPVPLAFMRAHREFVRLEPGAPFTVGPVRIQTLRNQHPGDSYSYRFEDDRSTFVFASDAEYKALDQASLQPPIDFFRGADALIFDAQYGLREAWESKVDWGHSSAMIGVDLARRAGVGRLILFHHEPTYSDLQLQEIQATAVAYQAQDSSLPFCEVLLGYEGMRLDLAPAALEVQLAPDGETAILTAGSSFDDQVFAQRLARLPTGGAAILDLAQVERLTTVQLKQLILAGQGRSGGPPVLAGPSPAVQEVIRLAGYGDHFAIYPAVAAALQAVAAREALNLPGQFIQQRYQIVDRLGPSRLGTVLRVADRREGSEDALRLLPPTLSAETLGRFEHHVARLRGLDMRGVARTLDFGRTADGAAFLVEELLDGPTLEVHLTAAAGPIAPGKVLTIALELTAVLEAVHRHGVIHGNVTPHDIFLTREGMKLAGFGLARLQEGRNLLEAPAVFITSSHAAPEQILGYPLDARTDLYGLGVTLYQLFTGSLPFRETGETLLRAHLEQLPLAPRALNPQLSPSVEHLLVKLLAKNPNERYAGATQVRRVLQSLQAGAGEADQLGRRPLVAREAQIAALEQIWAMVLAGRGQLVFIVGEPGIGKTSLAQRVAAQHPAAVVLSGACRKDGGPYHAVRLVLQSYLASVPPELFDMEARPLLMVLAELLPELREAVPGLEAAPLLEPQQARLRLTISIAQLISRATQARPWCLIIDDLHWADEGTLDLLSFLGRQAPEQQLLLLGTYRDTEVGLEHPLQGMLHELGRTPGYLRIALDRLEPAEVGRVLSQLWDETVPAALVAIIAEQTGGNPLYVEEVAKGLEDDGAVGVRGGVWRYPESAVVRLPRSVYEAVEQRIHYLSAETREILTLAAVLGLRFRFDDLVGLSGRSEWAVLEQLDLALERQLVEEVGGERELRFRHGEIHQVIYADLGELRRRHLHRRAGMILEERAGQAPEQVAAELAHHFGLAGEAKRELHYLMLAGQQAAAQFANRAALGYLSRALALMPEASPERADALAQAGGVRYTLGDYESARQQLEAALAIAEPAGEHGTCAAALYHLGRIALERGDYSQARAYTEASLALARAVEDRNRVAQALRGLGWVDMRQGAYREAEIHMTESMELCQALEDRQGLVRALNGLSSVASLGLKDYERARSLNLYALELARTIGARGQVADILVNLGETSRLMGAYDEAERYSRENIALCTETGDTLGTLYSITTLGHVAAARGDDSAAQASYYEALRIATELGAVPMVLDNMLGLAHILARSGESERALDLVGLAASHPSLYDETRPLLEQVLAELRAQLPAEQIDTGLERGKAWSLDEIVQALVAKAESP